jgi:hypothetical protein
VLCHTVDLESKSSSELKWTIARVLSIAFTTHCINCLRSIFTFSGQENKQLVNSKVPLKKQYPYQNRQWRTNVQQSWSIQSIKLSMIWHWCLSSSKHTNLQRAVYSCISYILHLCTLQELCTIHCKDHAL